MNSHATLTRLGLISAGLAIMAAAASAQTVVRPGFNVFSVDQDVTIGQQSALQVEKQLPMMNDATAQRYVSALGARLAARAPGPKFNYQFKITNQPEINAFALPGGFIYVNRGLLEQVRSEGELAGVMAHEIAHVALRHPTNQASKAYLAQAGLGVLGGMLGGKSGSSTGQIIGVLGGFGMNTLFLKFSRSVESQADVVGSQIMNRAGYNPVEMANFFGLLGQKSGSDPGKVARFMSDHPAPADREARVRQEARLLGAVPRIAPIGSLAAVQTRLRRSPAAPAAAPLANLAPTGGGNAPNGTGLGIEAPSTHYRVFRQPQGGYQLEQPDNWSANAATGNYGVTLLPQGGVVADMGGRDNIAYGVIINHYVPFDGSVGNNFTDPNGSSGYALSLEQATTDLVDQLLQSNPHLSRMNGTSPSATVAGERSLSVSLAGRSAATGRDERVTVVTRQLADEHIVYLLLIAPAGEYAALAPTFDHIVRTMRINDSTTHN